jgi:type I restriction enzyme S subunit
MQSVQELQAAGVLLVEDGNHGEYRPRPHEFVGTGTRFIRAADIDDSRVRFQNASCINETALARIRKGIGKPGDILFSHKGTVGKLAVVAADAPPFVCSPQTTFWRVLDESVLDRSYLYAYMRSPQFVRQWVVRKGETDMADYVSLTAQRSLRVVLPPKEIQRQVGAVLAAYDELIENNLRRIEILEEMAQAVYREWFVNFRFPGHQDVPVVESPLGPIPGGWEVTTLGQVADYISRGVSPKYDDESEAIVVNQKCVRNHRVSLESARSHSTKVKQEKELRFGDVLVNSTGVGTLGRVAQLRRPVENVTVDSHVTIIRPPSTIEPEYWGRAIFAKESRLEALGAGATGQTELRKSAVEAIDFLLPQPVVAKGYSDLVRPFDELAENLIAQNTSLRATRDLLLSRLVSGEIDVSDLDIDTEWLAS